MCYQKCQDYCHCLPLPCQISAVDIRHCDELPEVSGPGMSLKAGNRRKSPVTLAVTAGYFFSLTGNTTNLPNRKEIDNNRKGVR